MDPTTQYNAATNIAKDIQSATADLFFDASQVDTAPLETGSEDLLQVATANNPGGGTTQNTLPFQASKTGATTITVNSGTVDGVAYSGGVSISISATRKVYLDVTVSAAGGVTAVTVGNDTSVPSDTSTRAYVLLADVTVTGGAISDVTNYLSGSLGHAYGGGTTHILWRV